MLYVKSAAEAPFVESEFAKSEAFEIKAAGTEPEPVTETFDLGASEDFNTWTSSYSEHTLSYTNADIVFASANKQSGTITDCPVTKGGAIEIKMKNNAILTGVNITLKQWTTKAQTATLHYSTDGGINYSETSTKSSTFVLTNKELPSGTNAVKVTFSSNSNQVGCKYVEVTYVIR